MTLEYSDIARDQSVKGEDVPFTREGYTGEKVRKNSLRMQGYDYSQAGYYFVTVCTRERQCFFGEVIESRANLNDTGRIIETVWNDLPRRFPGTGLDEYLIMPNHIHGIVILGSKLDAGNVAPELGQVMRAFKAVAAHMIRVSGNSMFSWQDRYYDHIIRGEKDLDRIRQYIVDNPARWLDRRNENS